LIVIDQLDQLLDDLPSQHMLEGLLDVWNSRQSLVIVTAPDEPSRLAGITARLASRLSVGQLIRLHLPGPASRRWIMERFFLGRRLQATGVHIDWLNQWWESHPVTVSTMRGIVDQLAIYQVGPVTEPAQLRGCIQQILQGDALSVPSIDTIARIVARRFAIPLRELKSTSRRRTTVRARAAAMWLARKITQESYSRIGNYFRKRDHSTVLHACRTFESRIEADLALKHALESLESELRQFTSPIASRGKLVDSLSAVGR